MGAGNLASSFMQQSNQKLAATPYVSPTTGATQTALARQLGIVDKYGYPLSAKKMPAYLSLPAYTGQMSAGPNQGMLNQARQMLQAAMSGGAGAYKPQEFEDVSRRFREIADTGMASDVQAYLDKVSAASTREFQQNVLPQIKERTRTGGGWGSAVPEAISGAGQDFMTRLAGQMAPFALQAGEGAAGRRMAAVQNLAQWLPTAGRFPMELAGGMIGAEAGLRAPEQENLDRMYQEFVRRTTGGAQLGLQLGQLGKPTLLPFQQEKSDPMALFTAMMANTQLNPIMGGMGGWR